MSQSVAERPTELFGIMKKLPGIIRLVSGDLEVYRLIAPANDETIIRTFKDHGKTLEITDKQFFYGSNHARAIGFVRLKKELRIYECLADCLSGLPSDRQTYCTRDAGTDIFAPASQVTKPSWRKTIIIRF